MTKLSHRFDEALLYASRIHRKQKRNRTSIPYVSHLLAVAALALEAGADEDQAIAALLHDAVEDQGGLERLSDIEQLFGSRVAEIVSHCTDSIEMPKPEWRLRKQRYIESIGQKPHHALLVIVADKTHNASAILTDLDRHGAEVWTRFKGGKIGTLWYYNELGRTFAEHFPGDQSDRFTRIIYDIHIRHG